MSIDRRTVLGGALAMAGGKAADPVIPGGNGQMRPDQELNARHRTPALPPGAQSGLIRATIIIVSGGVVGGVFVYNGKPGLGNPPIVSITAGTKDPFGNTVVPGLDVTEGSITGTTISGSTFSGTDFVINSAGAFFYSGTPALGNLIYAIANSPGFDAFGNNYLGGGGVQYASSTPGGFYAFGPGVFVSGTNASGGLGLLHSATAGGPYAGLGGITIYSAGGGAAQFIVSDAGVVTPATSALAEVQGALAAESVAIAESSGTGGLLSVANGVTATGNPNVQLTGTGATDNMLGIEITGDTNNRLKIDAGGKHQWGSGSAGQDTNLYRGAANILQTDDSIALTNSSVIAGLSGAVLLSGASGTLQQAHASGLIGNSSMGVPATSPGLTVNGTSFANLATQVLPASDGNIAGAVYRLVAEGFGTWGTTEQLTLQLALGSTGIGSIQIAGAAFASAASIRWNATATFVVVTTGVSGTVAGHLKGSMNLTGTALNPGTAASNTLSFDCGQTTAATFNTTTSQTLNIQAEWAGTTGTPTITSMFYYFERVA